ncbi:MAG TPA: hypothetical protein VKD28_02020 [Gemmatimonadales bacterium]|nr:hypothetical protein [Gemmatimonadales bacterium]
MKFALLVVFLWLAFATNLICSRYAYAQTLYTGDEVLAWIDFYSAHYATGSYPYERLVRDSVRIARCESGGFDERVINNTRRGRLGEIGTFQFLPGPRSIFWVTPTAAAGWDYWDPESNVAGAVWLLANGYGRHWSCR